MTVFLDVEVEVGCCHRRAEVSLCGTLVRIRELVGQGTMSEIKQQTVSDGLALRCQFEQIQICRGRKVERSSTRASRISGKPLTNFASAV